jgi:predicted amidophosphoribosyltransferase
VNEARTEETDVVPSLCWSCSEPQGFYQKTCPNCGATNPNVDLPTALAEQESNHGRK